MTTLLGAGALIGIAAAAAFGLSMFDDFEVAFAPQRARAGVTSQPQRDDGPQRAPKQEEPDPSQQARPDQPAAGGSSAQPASSDLDVAQRDAERAEQARRERAQAQETEAQDLRRKRMIESDWRERSQRQARQGIVVVMYSTSWCPSCVAARSYMDGHGIAYVDHDIDQSESARLIMRRLNPRGSVPTIDIDGTVLVGFGAGSLEAALDGAARKRAGI
jgi:glutaredoxin